MISHVLLGQIDIKQISNGVVAGTGDTQTLTEVAFAGQFDSCLFLLNLGAVTATGVGTFRAKGSNTTATYGAGTIGCFIDPLTVDPVSNATGSIASSYCFTGDSNLVLALDVYRPNVAFARAEMVRATANIVILSATAILYGSHTAPWTVTGCASHSATGPGYYVVANPTLSAA